MDLLPAMFISTLIQIVSISWSGGMMWRGGTPNILESLIFRLSFIMMAGFESIIGRWKESQIQLPLATRMQREPKGP